MPVPIPKLDDKEFEVLVDQAKLLVPRHAPKWTDHNVHDPGITLIELFAWLAETQIYTLDQITERHREKFLRLLGHSPRFAQPARAVVKFMLPEGRTDPFKVPQGTRLIGRRTGTDIDLPFETSRDLWVVSPQLVKIERINPRGRVDLTDDWTRGLFLYGLGGEWGDPIEVGSRLRLGFSDKFPQREITFAIDLYEADLPPLGMHGEEEPDVVPSAEVQWEYLAEGDRWLSLPGLVDETRALSVSGSIRFTGPADPPPKKSEGFYWLRCRVTQFGYEIPPRIAAIHLNTVTAIEGRSVPRHSIGFGSGLPSQRIEVGEAPILAGSLELEVQETPDGPWESWTQVPGFDASGPGNRHYMIDHAQGIVAFGNGFHGRIAPRVSLPLSGTVSTQEGSLIVTGVGTSFTAELQSGDRIRVGQQVMRVREITSDTSLAVDAQFGAALPAGTPIEKGNIRASYRVGGGERGNLAAGEINRIVETGFEGVTVTNPEPATGGSEPESIAAAWSRVRADLSVPYRAVTSEDFETLAKATPGLRVARAKAIPGFDPKRPGPPVNCLVTVVVVPYSFTPCPMPSEGFLKTVCRHLDRHRLITTDLRVIRPLYVKVSVDAEVTVRPKSAPAEVRKRIEQALADFLDPLRGGVQKTGWPFGRSVYRSELANLIEWVDGVECVVQLTLHGDRGKKVGGNLVDFPPTALVCPDQFRVEIREQEPVCEVK